jgi:protein gp37
MTSIEWTDETWNPTDGCSVCSPGCANCYAMRFAGRFAKPGERYHGLVTVGKNKRAIWTGVLKLDSGKLAKPLRWKKPRRIFVNSMSDLFHENLTNEQIAAVFGVMAACPQHTFQVLTKRAKRMREWFGWLHSTVDPYPAGALDLMDDAATAELAGHFDCCHLNLMASCRWPLPNVHLGVSVENQDAADERIPDLLATPAEVRFLSCEPLIGPIQFKPFTLGAGTFCFDCGSGVRVDEDGCCATCGADGAWWFGVDWVIAGCESGPGARPAEVLWLRSMRDQCATATATAGVPFFLKQAREQLAPILVDGSHEDARPYIVECGLGSKRKPGGVIGLPYLDGVQHAQLPVTP